MLPDVGRCLSTCYRQFLPLRFDFDTQCVIYLSFCKLQYCNKYTYLNICEIFFALRPIMQVRTTNYGHAFGASAFAIGPRRQSPLIICQVNGLSKILFIFIQRYVYGISGVFIYGTAYNRTGHQHQQKIANLINY